MPLILPRGLAIARGEQDYFTGIPCKRGHVALRTVSSGMCKECASESNKVWMKNNSEYRKAFDKEAKKKNRIKILAQKKAWRLRNLDRALEIERRTAAKIRAIDPDRYRRQSAKWAKENPEKARVHIAARRARQVAAEGSFTPKDVSALFRRQKGLCAYCFIKVGKSYHIDHILPLVKGGTNWPDNLQICCKPCNLSKGKKTHDEFVQYRARSA